MTEVFARFYLRTILNYSFLHKFIELASQTIKPLCTPMYIIVLKKIIKGFAAQ
jgi:hypothetical protein